MKHNIIFGISVLSGIATFDGICKSFRPATNVVSYVGQKCVAGANGVLAFGVTWCIGCALADGLEKVVNATKDTIKVDIEFTKDDEVTENGDTAEA